MVPLKRITAYDVAVAFVEHWVFKYGAPTTVVSDNGSQLWRTSSVGFGTYCKCTTSSPTHNKASRSLQREQARYNRDFDMGIRATRRIQTDNFIFLDTHDGTDKRPKLTHNISGPFRVLGHDSNTILIQQGEVVERVSRDRVTLAPKQAITRAARIGDAQPKHLQAKRTSGRSYTFSKILGHRELQSGDLEFKISWDGNYKLTWEPRDCVPEEAISRYFARYRRELNTRQ